MEQKIKKIYDAILGFPDIDSLMIAHHTKGGVTISQLKALADDFGDIDYGKRPKKAYIADLVWQRVQKTEADKKASDELAQKAAKSEVAARRKVIPATGPTTGVGAKRPLLRDEKVLKRLSSSVSAFASKDGKEDSDEKFAKTPKATSEKLNSLRKELASVQAERDVLREEVEKFRSSHEELEDLKKIAENEIIAALDDDTEDLTNDLVPEPYVKHSDDHSDEQVNKLELEIFSLSQDIKELERQRDFFEREVKKVSDIAIEESDRLKADHENEIAIREVQAIYNSLQGISQRHGNFSVSCATHRGNNPGRPINEDAYFAGDISMRMETGRVIHARCIVVADGMGGHDSGEFSSGVLVHYIPAFLETFGAVKHLDHALISAVEHANKIILRSKERYPTELGKTGAAMVAALFYEDKMYWVSAGDCRIIQITSAGNTAQVTVDDTVAAKKLAIGDIPDNRDYSILTSCMGLEDDLSLQKGQVRITPGQKFIFCTDGPLGIFTNDQLKEIVLDFPYVSALEIVDRTAFHAGSTGDNSAVVVASVWDTPIEANTGRPEKAMSYQSNVVRRFAVESTPPPPPVQPPPKVIVAPSVSESPRGQVVVPAPKPKPRRGQTFVRSPRPKPAKPRARVVNKPPQHSSQKQKRRMPQRAYRRDPEPTIAMPVPNFGRQQPVFEQMTSALSRYTWKEIGLFVSIPFILLFAFFFIWLTKIVFM